MDIRYRIYTERKENLSEIVGRYFDGFTLFEGLGFWKGKPEKSTTVIEILATPSRKRKIHNVARDILRENKQESVIVTSESIRGTSIT